MYKALNAAYIFKYQNMLKCFKTCIFQRFKSFLNYTENLVFGNRSPGGYLIATRPGESRGEWHEERIAQFCNVEKTHKIFSDLETLKRVVDKKPPKFFPNFKIP